MIYGIESKYGDLKSINKLSDVKNILKYCEFLGDSKLGKNYKDAGLGNYEIYDRPYKTKKDLMKVFYK